MEFLRKLRSRISFEIKLQIAILASVTLLVAILLQLGHAKYTRMDAGNPLFRQCLERGTSPDQCEALLRAALGIESAPAPVLGLHEEKESAGPALQHPEPSRQDDPPGLPKD
jgi:hypothetical protein